LNSEQKQTGRWAGLRKALAIAALVLVGATFLSGVGIFAYQMLHAA
jgi:hypothetical protein